MVSKKSRTAVRENKHRRMRHHLAGTAQRPRLAVFRSNNHMYAQIIDDTVGNTLVSASTLDKELKAELEKTNNVDAASKLGTVIAKKALDKGITTVVFDRGGFIYQGKVKALAPQWTPLPERNMWAIRMTAGPQEAVSSVKLQFCGPLSVGGERPL